MGTTAANAAAPGRASVSNASAESAPSSAAGTSRSGRKNHVPRAGQAEQEEIEQEVHRQIAFRTHFHFRFSSSPVHYTAEVPSISPVLCRTIHNVFRQFDTHSTLFHRAPKQKESRTSVIRTSSPSKQKKPLRRIRHAADRVSKKQNDNFARIRMDTGKMVSHAQALLSSTEFSISSIDRSIRCGIGFHSTFTNSAATEESRPIRSNTGNSRQSSAAFPMGSR